MTSNNNIIELLILSSIIASFTIHIIFGENIKGLMERKKLFVSFQRLSHAVVLLAKDSINSLTLIHYLEKIKLLSRKICAGKKYNLDDKFAFNIKN